MLTLTWLSMPFIQSLFPVPGASISYPTSCFALLATTFNRHRGQCTRLCQRVRASRWARQCEDLTHKQTSILFDPSTQSRKGSFYPRLLLLSLGRWYNVHVVYVQCRPQLPLRYKVVLVRMTLSGTMGRSHEGRTIEKLSLEEIKAFG